MTADPQYRELPEGFVIDEEPPDIDFSSQRPGEAELPPGFQIDGTAPGVSR